MTKLLLGAGLTLGIAAGAFAQKPKSQDEVKALQAMFASQNDPDAQIAAANTVLEKFADTEFKSVALFTIASDYQRKNDYPKAVTYGERSLEADPKNFQAMLLIASEYARNTQDTDFDEEEKLKDADKYANLALTILKDAPKMNPSMPDADWTAAKKDLSSNAYEILGQIQMVRKKPDAALKNFRLAVDTAAHPDPSTYVRLAQADNMLGKYDDAIASAEKAMNSPDALPTVKQFAQAERARATSAKAKGSPIPAAAPAAGTTTPQP